MVEDKASIIVTGDIVLDFHLYGGVKTRATSFDEPGTTRSEHAGGAALTHALLCAAADADGLAWDVVNESWKKENTRRQENKKPPLPKPEALESPRPEQAYSTHLELDIDDLDKRLPSHLRSYGVWIDKPAGKDSKDRVWRIERDFGYGPTNSQNLKCPYKKNSAKPNGRPILTLIDDGGILFRHGQSEEAWPDFDKSQYYLLKMSSPLCIGDLWAELEKVKDNLIVVVSAGDLRREHVQINSRLSWEMCTEQTTDALLNDPSARGLLKAAHVVVTFGSAGALWVTRDTKGNIANARLFFDPRSLEGEHARGISGTTYGFQTCMVAGIAHHLMAQAGNTSSKPFVNPVAMGKGIAAGLMAKRQMLELGHGPVGSPTPGVPIKQIGGVIARDHGGIACVDISIEHCLPLGRHWTILAQCETSSSAGTSAPAPLKGLANMTARFGPGALSEIPALRLGKLFTVDRTEIESLRALEALIREYEEGKVQKKPLSIGVFGPPGAGKSFGVRALAESILGKDVPFLEFNLSQFKDPSDLIGAFHRVRDAVLKGVTPVAFWDEFDSRQYFWLQYLLAPMQDGAFQEGQITHPIGKCIFIFAGGTSDTMEGFGTHKPDNVDNEHSNSPEALKREKPVEMNNAEVEHHQAFKLLKGPDFISRLHGFLNVLGPNRRIGTDFVDVTWPIRRAIMLRGILGLKDDEELKIDLGLLDALLSVPIYHNGARSFEKIITALVNGRSHNEISRSALPPMPLLNRETQAEEFYQILKQRDAFKNHPNIEEIAAAIHENYRQSMAEAGQKLSPDVDKPYAELSPDKKTANLSAARRIPDHLALIGYVVEPLANDEGDAWKQDLTKTINDHLDRFAMAEHLGWCAERIANGWTPGVRNDVLKRHPALVPWVELTPADKKKDRDAVLDFPRILRIAKYKAVTVSEI